MTAAMKEPAFLAYSHNHLIGADHGIIMDVERPDQSGR